MAWCVGRAPARLLVLATPAALAAVPIATFDGAAGTTWPWTTVDDPVMGGQSKSTVEVDEKAGVATWTGSVEIVPFLGAPGFCIMQAPGLRERADFPDLSGEGGIVVRAKAEGMDRFSIHLMSKGARHLGQEGVYEAPFNASAAWADHFVPWSAFRCSWRGQNVTWCPDLRTQLKEITSVGIGTYFPGPAGHFRVEVSGLSAGSPPTRRAAPAATAVDLANFDGSAPHAWKTENDPVMGGQSSSDFLVEGGSGFFKGSCRIVPSLHAPGFNIALTETPLVGHFPDVSKMDGLSLGVRLAGGNISSFKVAFCDTHVNPFRCQFQSFKANFQVMPSEDIQDVFVPWSAFSDKWSPYTGEHTSENPPEKASLRGITQLQIWAEGVLGDFNLQLQRVRAVKAEAGWSVLV